MCLDRTLGFLTGVPTRIGGSLRQVVENPPTLRAALPAGLAVLLATACVTTPIYQKPWLEVRTVNFEIVTNLQREKAVELIDELEVFRATVDVVTNVERLEPRVPTRIIAFAGSRDFARFRSDRQVRGYFDAGLRANTMALDTSGKSGIGKATLFHEYTHFLVHNQDQLVYPLWFNEGFAEFMSSVFVHEDVVFVGSVPRHRRDTFQYVDLLPFGKVIRARDFGRMPPEQISMFYAQSWAIVHFLMYGREERDFAKENGYYLYSLGRGLSEEEAFERAFDLDFSGLRKGVLKHLKQRRLPYVAFKLERPRPDVAPSVRPLRPDEVAVELGWLALRAGFLERTHELFREALVLNPQNSRAHAGLGDALKFQGHWEEAEAPYRRALALSPNDPENHLEYAEYLHARARVEPDRTEEFVSRAREHYRQCIALAPKLPEGYAMLGATYLFRGEDPQEGIELLETAREMLPSQTSLLFNLAQLYKKAGRRDAARDTLELVLHWSHRGELATRAAQLLDELEAADEQPVARVEN